MCLPSWLYRSLHSARFMGHGFLSVGALLSFQNHLLESETYWIKKKILVCATKFRTNILCKNSKTAGKALAAAWNPSKCWHLGNLRLTLRFDFFCVFCIFCIFCILYMVPFFLQFRKLQSTNIDLSICTQSHNAARLHFDSTMTKMRRTE